MRRSIFLLLGVSLLRTVFAAIPDYSLLNESGKTTKFYDLKGSYILLSFIFTRCPDPNMCPRTVKLNKQVLAAWKTDRLLQSKPLKVVFVTLDPKGDSPAVLKKYAAAQGLNLKDFTLLTSKNPDDVSKFTEEFNVFGIPGKGTIAHRVKTVLLAPDLSVVQAFKDNEWKAEDVLKSVKK